MGNTLMSLLVKLSVDNGEFISGMNTAEGKAKTTSASIAKSFSSVGASLTKTGGVLSAAVTAPIVAAGFKMVEAASSLDESLNKVNVVFGESAGEIVNWSKSTASSMGISQAAALEAAGTYGNLFVAMGMTKPAAAEMSTSLVGLAADLASFNNASPEDVLLALRSGLSGEIEPLKKFGIAMNEAILKTKAMELGMGDNIQALTEAQKIQVRYAVIMDQTTSAQGDFARTSDGLANSTRIMKAELADAAAKMGTQLLPIALKLVQGLTWLVEKFIALPEPVKTAILVIAGIVAVVGPLLVIIGSIASAIGAIIPVVTALGPAFAAVGAVLTGTVIPAIGAFLAAAAPIILPLLAIIAVLALLYFAWKNNWLGIRDVFDAWVKWFKGIWDNVWRGALAVFEFFRKQVTIIQEAFHQASLGNWRKFGELLRQVWDNTFGAIVNIVKSLWDRIKQNFSDGINNVISFFRDTNWGDVGRGIIEGIANGIRNGVGSIISAAQEAASAALEAAKGFLGISSPSKVFKMEVGYQMAAGVASGWETGLDSLLNVNGLSPSGVAVPSAAPVSDTSNTNRDIIDYNKLARVLRDALMQGKG